ncbi:MAG: hypothetical protein P1U32_04740 [Legionellaceae bacterium]|nr:hypothetical protein [Legionellaceae bacterium]
MGTVYVEGVISADSDTLNAKLGAWEVLRGFSNAFGDISGITVSSEALGNTFYMKINGDGIRNNHTPSTVKKIEDVFENLRDKEQFASLRTLEEKPELVSLFEQLETGNNPTTSVLVDEDLDVYTELTEASLAKGQEDVLLQEKEHRATPATEGLSESDSEEEDAHTSYNPMHRSNQ